MNDMNEREDVADIIEFNFSRRISRFQCPAAEMEIGVQCAVGAGVPGESVSNRPLERGAILHRTQGFAPTGPTNFSYRCSFTAKSIQPLALAPNLTSNSFRERSLPGMLNGG